MYNKELLISLQKEASEFLQSKYLVVNDTKIFLKEIEVYYYETGKFEDYTVHRNKLQGANKYKFYIHRYGKEVDSSYKSSSKNNRGGCDFVISDSNNIYYSYLIRSIVINDELIIGPRKTLDAIIANTVLSYEQLEKIDIKVISCESYYDVLKTPRIGLGNPPKAEDSLFKDEKLRFILCDNYFCKQNGYKLRTRAIDDFLEEQLKNGKMTKEQAICYSNKWYKSVSKWLRDLE